ncbi:MAG: hypothetical protein WC262_07060 [Bacteroidales bacterium]|jgi:hypothetical protein
MIENIAVSIRMNGRVKKYAEGKVPGVDEPDEIVEFKDQMAGKDAEKLLKLVGKDATDYIKHKARDKTIKFKKNNQKNRRKGELSTNAINKRR